MAIPRPEHPNPQFMRLWVLVGCVILDNRYRRIPEGTYA